MTERQKGWHPDPYGIHVERYYYADDRPGRLVRDDGRNEFYDEIPEGAPRPPTEPVAWNPQGDTPGSVPTAPTPSHAPQAPQTHIEPDPPVASSPALVAPAGMVSPLPPLPEPHDDHWPDEPSHAFSRAIDRLTTQARHYWAVGSVLALILVVAIGAIIFWPNGTTRPPASAGHGASGHDSNRSSNHTATHTSGTASGGNGGLQVTNAAGSGSTVTTEAPTAWGVAQAFPTSTQALNGVACPSTLVCLAIGKTTLTTGMVLRTQDGAATWAQEAIPKGVGALNAISCPSISMCIAVGGTTVITSTDGGITWAVQLLGNQALTAISCATIVNCMAVGGVLPTSPNCDSGAAYASTNGGQSWTTTALPCFVPSGLSCPTTTHCAVSGYANRQSDTNGEIMGTDDDGVKWQVQYRSDQKGSELSAVSCPTADACVAVGTVGGRSIIGTADGGAAWLPQRYPVGSAASGYSAVFCRSANSCQVAGTAFPLSSGDGGTTWVRQSIASSIAVVTGIACPSDLGCVGVGNLKSQGGGGGATLTLML
jgi:photosystem II stability/assembly factor-like uncharacterized protein